MHYKSSNYDIYIGKQAGKELIKDIREAKKSVKIVSPYLSAKLIDELIELRTKGIDVQLITTDEIEDYPEDERKNIFRLIYQHRKTDNKSVKDRNSYKRISTFFFIISFVLLIFLAFIYYNIRDNVLLFAIIPIMFIFLIHRAYSYKYKIKKIYKYWYSQLFPFKVYASPSLSVQSKTFIHSKIFIIDDEKAHLGSLNFTSSGIIHNYETRIKLKDKLTVTEIIKEFNFLFNHSQIPEIDIQGWGNLLYDEPIN